MLLCGAEENRSKGRRLTQVNSGTRLLIRHNREPHGGGPRPLRARSTNPDPQDGGRGKKEVGMQPSSKSRAEVAVEKGGNGPILDGSASSAVFSGRHRKGPYLATKMAAGMYLEHYLDSKGRGWG